MKFKDKVVLVTGAGRGIGRAIALAFGKEGAKVVINYAKDEKAATEVAEQINKTSEAITVKCDVSDLEQVKSMVAKVVEAFGKIDVLVNNAGIVFDVPFKDRTLEQWQRTLDVNLTGPYLCVKACLPHMAEGGSVINISSTNGIDSFHADSIDYDATKAGLIQFTRALARETAPKIRVNCVAPGWIDTDINKNLPADYVKSETAKIAMGRFGEPEEIAACALFLASPEASFVTGSVIVADGGYGGAHD